MLKSILVALDGSERSRKTLALGFEFAKGFNAKVLLIRVMQIAEFDASIDRITEELHELCRQMRFEGIDCKYRIDIGDPADQIIQAADDIQAAIILVGGRRAGEAGRSRESELSKILNHTHCAVTVIP